MKNWDPRYEEILYRPHPVSPDHPAMPLRERAAQFAAYKALTGFEEEIAEEGRFTETAAELDEERKMILNEQLLRLEETGETAVFVWFRPDPRKEGGSYCHSRTSIKRFDPVERCLCLGNGERIPLQLLHDVEDDGLAAD